MAGQLSWSSPADVVALTHHSLAGTQGGEIDFPTYLNAVEKTQLVTFLTSAQGKAQAAKAGSARKLMGSALISADVEAKISVSH